MGCLMCTNPTANGTCVTCSEGFLFIPDNKTCITCPDDMCCHNNNSGAVISNCEACSDDQLSCTKCLPHYKLSEDGNCVECEEEECCPGDTHEAVSRFCSSCDNTTGKCHKCARGELLYKGKCYDQPLVNVTENPSDLNAIKNTVFLFCRDNYLVESWHQCCLSISYGINLSSLSDVPPCAMELDIVDNMVKGLFVILNVFLIVQLLFSSIIYLSMLSFY